MSLSPPKTDVSLSPQRPFSRISWFIVLPLTLFIIFVYGFGIALYLRSPIAIEQRSSFHEPTLGIPQQPPYFHLIFSDLSYEHLFLTMRWSFFRNLILTYDWIEFRYNVTIVGLRDGFEFPIRRVFAQRNVFEFESSTTTEFPAFSLSGVPYTDIIVSISFDRCVRALVGIHHHITFARSETVYWLRPIQTVVELLVTLSLFLLLCDFPFRIAAFQIWSFFLVILVVFSLDPLLLSTWIDSEPLLLVTQQALSRLLRHYFRAYVLLHLAFFTSHDTPLNKSLHFWLLLFAAICGHADYRGTFDTLEAVQASHAIVLPWSYGEIIAVIGDVCFAGFAFASVANLYQKKALDAWQRTLWAAVAGGAAIHGIVIALMKINRDFVPFAGEMEAALMYGAVAAVIVLGFRPVAAGDTGLSGSAALESS
jgi:hypothetical protein